MTPTVSQVPVPALPTAPASPPVFGSGTSPGQKPGNKSTTPSFLNASAPPAGQSSGMKTLIGQ